MQIRKNTKAYKTILAIVSTCQGRADREKLIRLYITKAGNSIDDRINVEGIQGGEAGFFYDMTYETVLNNLQSANHQLWASDEIPGIYFFHSTSNKVWDETPFEFDEAVLKEFSTLPELPTVRKKEKAEKYILTEPSKKSEKAPVTSPKKAEPVKKVVAREIKKPSGPDFKLNREIEFTNLDRVIFRQSKLTKLGVLEYYNKIAEYILPYLKDRTLSTRRDTETQKPALEMSVSSLLGRDKDELPDWIKRQSVGGAEEKQEMLLINDKEHLLYYVEGGSVQFDHSLSKLKPPASPTFLIISIDSPEFDIAKAVVVALAARQVFDGLGLRSVIKTDGLSALHVYIPLDAKSTFEESAGAAEFICKLIRLKLPDLVSLEGYDEYVYGKVSLDHSYNAPGKTIVAPYSLVSGQSAIVATPLLWDEVNEALRPESFNHESIFKRIKQMGDPLEGNGKKVDAAALLERLEANYAFLF